MKKFFVSTWEILEVVLISAGTVILIRTFLIQPFLVSGPSMEPNFENGDYLLIDEVTYRFREPIRGEVVVFRYPNDERVFFIKRIIGLPGERIVGRGGRISVFANGSAGESEELKESYISAGNYTGDFEAQLGTDQFFVMGDNRSFSFDSRSWGPVKAEHIVGLVRLRIFPFGSFGSFLLPRYAFSRDARTDTPFSVSVNAAALSGGYSGI